MKYVLWHFKAGLTPILNEGYCRWVGIDTHFLFSTDCCFKINHNTAKQVMLVAFLKLKVYNLKDASLYNIYLQVGQHII